MNPNPFLTSEANQAGTDARMLYMQSLNEQQSVGQPVDWLERMLRLSQNNLESTWRVALDTATAGNVQDGLNLLVSFITEWGRYKAFQYLIDAEQHRVVLDLWNPFTYATIQQDIQIAIDNQVVYLTSQLHNALLAGQAQRERESQNSLLSGYTGLHDIAMWVIQRQDTNLQQAHLTNQQYADTAFNGVKQAQQSVYWMQEGVQNMYQFVQGHGANMVGGMQALQNHLEQNLPSYVENAHRRRTTRMVVLCLVIFGIVVGLFALAAFVGTHLVGG